MTRTPSTPPRWFVFVPALIAVLGLMSLSMPYFLLLPGEPVDVLPLITVSGAETRQSEGKLMLTTVSVRSLMSCPGLPRISCAPVANAVYALINPNIEMVYRDRILGPKESEEDADRRSIREMDESQRIAAAAALKFLGFPVQGATGIAIAQVRPDVPAASVLRQGDVILAVDGNPVCTDDALRAGIIAAGVGGRVTLRVQRGGQEVDVSTETVANPDEPSRPVVGIDIAVPAPPEELPVDIDIDDSRGIGGPSAGLMFALGIVELLGPEDLTRGRTIAGTGVIAPAGCVGPISGIRQKVVGAESRGAEIFLAPVGQIAEACAAADRVEVRGVATIADAVRVLNDPATAPAPRCPGG